MLSGHVQPVDEPIAVLDARADALEENHENLLRDLRKMRIEHGLTQEVVAERMGVTQPSVSQFERYDANPTLDTVRRYAMAVGARLSTTVIDDTGNDPRSRGEYLFSQSRVEPVRAVHEAPRNIAWGSSRTKLVHT